MFNIDNHTPFTAMLSTSLDVHCTEMAIVVIKGTWRIESGGLSVAAQQRSVLDADVHHGKPGTSSVRYESDHGPPKAATDVVMVGHARSEHAVRVIDVRLSVGTLDKTVRVFGERSLRRESDRWIIGEPQPFDALPLVYERAFGGPSVPENPVGLGAGGESETLPNLEDPEALIDGPQSQPVPAGFGFIARHWAPRAGFSGTCDENWKRDRMPLLPLDFDEWHHQSAHPSLISDTLTGAEAVRVSGVTAGEPLVFSLPGTQLRAFAHRGAEHVAHLDTVLIEPDRREVVLTWRTSIPMGRRAIDLRRVTISEAT